MSYSSNDDSILEQYRQLYPYLTEDQIVELRERKRRFLVLALRQIRRLKPEAHWPIDKHADTIRGLFGLTV